MVSAPRFAQHEPPQVPHTQLPSPPRHPTRRLIAPRSSPRSPPRSPPPTAFHPLPTAFHPLPTAFPATCPPYLLLELGGGLSEALGIGGESRRQLHHQRGVQ